MTKIELLDTVTTRMSIPGTKVHSGMVGTVVEFLDEATYLVEFSDEFGKTIALHPFKSKDIDIYMSVEKMGPTNCEMKTARSAYPIRRSATPSDNNTLDGIWLDGTKVGHVKVIVSIKRKTLRTTHVAYGLFNEKEYQAGSIVGAILSDLADESGSRVHKVNEEACHA